MKRVFIAVLLMSILLVTGCTSKQEIVKEEENTKIVYCNDCGESSKEVTNFCSQCGIEAKWVAEKPEIKKVEDNTNEEDKDTKQVVDNKKEEDKNIKNETEKEDVYVPRCEVCNSKKVVYDDAATLCQSCLDSANNNEFSCEDGLSKFCYGCKICKGYDTYKPSDYDIYHPQGGLECMYTCVDCGRTSNLSMGTIGICEKCIDENFK